ncbi:MAG: hypothetical protein ABIO24_09865 [Saprospiraceae bacterium]
MRPRRTFFYLPGLISLSVLPLLFSVIGEIQGDFTPAGIIKVHCSRDSDYVRDNRNTMLFRRPIRQYAPCFISGNTASDATVFSSLKDFFIQSGLKRDKLSGMHIQFYATAKYSAFVKTLDLIKQEKWINYQICPGGIWIWQEEPIMIGIWKPGIGLYDCIVDLEKDLKCARIQKEMEIEFENKYLELIWVFWPVWFLFFMLVISQYCQLALQPKLPNH